MESPKPLSDTWIGSPSFLAPSPLTALYRVSVKGFRTNPAYGFASLKSATDTAHMGMPREKFAVPSMGSTIQVHSESWSDASSPSSPMNADPGTIFVNLSLRNLSFSMSAEVTRFSLEPFVVTVKERFSLTLRPDSLITLSISANTCLLTAYFN